MLLLALVQLFGFATTSPAADTTKPTDTAYYQLPQIVVSGSRLPQNWLEAPQAISVISVDPANALKGIGLDNVLNGVPGLLAQSRYGTGDIRITMRGYGARGAGERSNAATSRGVRVMLDGFPLTEPDGRTALDLADPTLANQIEVVRSNGSASWGNASGGVLNISTHPTVATPFVQSTQVLGEYGFHKSIVRSGLPIRNGSVFTALSYADFDGWREHSFGSQRVGYASLVSIPDPGTRLGVYIVAARNQFRIPGPLTWAQVNQDPRQAQGDTSNYAPSYVDRDERRDNKLGRLGVSFDRELSERQALSLSAFVSPKYLQRSERNTFRDFTRYHVGGSAKYQQELVNRPGFLVQMVVGFDEAYQDGAILFYGLTSGERGAELRTDKREGANNFGVFAQSEVVLNQRWHLQAALRWDNVGYFYDDHIDPSLNTRKHFREFTPRLGASYLLSEKASVYAQMAQGIEVPAGNETDPPSTFGEDTVTAINPLLEPIRSTTLELGTKGTMQRAGLVKNLTYDIALYHIEVRDDIVPYRGGRFYFTAGKSRRTGLELGAAVQTRPGIDISGSLTLSRNRYVDYVVDSVHYGNAGATADYGGNKMAGIPDYFFSLGARYNVPVVKTLFAEIRLSGSGGYFADDANRFSVEDYLITNVGIGIDKLALGRSGFAVGASVTVHNISDKAYIGSAFINPDVSRITGDPIYLEPGLPRNVTGSINLSYNL